MVSRIEELSQDELISLEAISRALGYGANLRGWTPISPPGATGTFADPPSHAADHREPGEPLRHAPADLRAPKDELVAVEERGRGSGGARRLSLNNLQKLAPGSRQDLRCGIFRTARLWRTTGRAGSLRMRLRSADIARAAQPGQFCMVEVVETLYPFLRRPMCLSEIDDGFSLLQSGRRRHAASFAAGAGKPARYRVLWATVSHRARG